MDAGPGVFLGEVVAKQQDGFAKIFAINSTPSHITLKVNPIEFEDFSIKTPPSRTTRKENSSGKSIQDQAQRISEILKILKLDDLTEIEKESILGIVGKFPYQFYLPGDELGSTSLISHNIRTTDDIPINTKQYRFPLVHKDEIKKLK